MEAKIAVLAGDGIGPEVMKEALRVLAVISKKYGHKFEIREALIGGAAFEACGKHFPDETKQICDSSDAILFGSVGGPVSEALAPKWKDCERNSLLGIRKAFNFHANLRPARVYPSLKDCCPLSPQVISTEIDLLIVRELIGDIYFGEHKTFTENGMRVATDVASYTEKQVSDIAHVALKEARMRRKKVTSVDKANVLDTSRLWRELVHEVARKYPDVEISDMLVDNCAMQLVRNPAQFDVIVTSNLFGDILSDLASVLPGSLGLTPSASFNNAGFAMYEPSGGSAPDIAGQGIANPTAQILSVAMMLRSSFNLVDEALTIENAVGRLFETGIRTKDIYKGQGQIVSTVEFTNRLIGELA